MASVGAAQELHHNTKTLVVKKAPALHLLQAVRASAPAVAGNDLSLGPVGAAGPGGRGVHARCGRPYAARLGRRGHA